jgi:hypothetical protein
MYNQLYNLRRQNQAVCAPSSIISAAVWLKVNSHEQDNRQTATCLTDTSSECPFRQQAEFLTTSFLLKVNRNSLTSAFVILMILYAHVAIDSRGDYLMGLIVYV